MCNVYYYLHKKLDDNYDVIAQLEHQLLSEEMERKVSEDKYNKQIHENEKDFKVEIDKLNNRMTEVDEKLFGMKEIDGYKQSIETEMSQLLRALEDERSNHFTQVQELERANVKEKEALKNELLEKLRQAKIELTDKANETLVEIKRKARADHTKNAEKLHNHGMRATTVLKKNIEEHEINNEIKRNLGVSNDIQATMKNREIAYQRQIASLTKELQELGTELEDKMVELQESREEMTMEEQSELDAIQELEASLAAQKQGLIAAAEAAEDSTAEYEIEVMAQQELNKFLSVALSDCRRQAQLISSRGGVIPDWNDDRLWEPNVVIPPRLNELSLAQRRAVFKFLLSEIHRYKLRVESVMEKRRHDEMLEERKRNKRAEKGGGGGGGGGGDGTASVGWRASSGIDMGEMAEVEEEVKPKTGIAGWDHYDANNFLGGILALTQVAEKQTRTMEVQTEHWAGDDVSLSSDSTLAPLGGHRSRSKWSR
ncbi:hypothetical protein TeGR_g6414 [Tetraparma gracilis]|uniref:Cilia- and flagella-associated protein 157 n=1 Tax=Tetraparma gracilis TaxID=2962635 RepID=A0ABQ6MZX5_9STRA|nr:hypothetical protein TeGR_g6414 [Tetraparma gracilis]